MLVACKNGCKISSTTEPVLNIKTDKIQCKKCEEELPHISDSLKGLLKSSGEIYKPKVTAFQFTCTHCNKIVRAIKGEGKEQIVGQDCVTPKACTFDLPTYTRHGIITLGSNSDKL